MASFIVLTNDGGGKIIINPADIVSVSDGLYPTSDFSPVDFRHIRLRCGKKISVEETMSEIMMKLKIDKNEIRETIAQEMWDRL